MPVVETAEASAWGVARHDQKFRFKTCLPLRWRTVATLEEKQEATAQHKKARRSRRCGPCFLFGGDHKAFVVGGGANLDFKIASSAKIILMQLTSLLGNEAGVVLDDPPCNLTKDIHNDF